VELSERPNVLLITFDSCRWDAFEKACTPVIDSLGQARLAHAQATFTYAAHLALYQGHFPSCRERIVYYNRFTRPLFRIASTDAPVEGFACFPLGTPNIIYGLHNLGYHALGYASTGWFRHPDLRAPFDEFELTGINADLQVDLFTSRIARLSVPFVALLNFGETHDPYEHGGQIPPSEISRARATFNSVRSSDFDRPNWIKQVRSCEFLDERVGLIAEWLRKLPRATIVVLCADHGECFGEDGLHGHGFYHPKVMEVPLAIFAINGELPEQVPEASSQPCWASIHSKGSG